MTHAGYAIAGSCHFPPSENNSVLTGRHESEHQTCHGTRRPSRGLLRNATSSWRTTVRRPGDRGGGGAELSPGPPRMPTSPFPPRMPTSRPQSPFIPVTGGCVKQDSYYFCIKTYLKCHEFSTEAASASDPKRPEGNNTTFST